MKSSLGMVSAALSVILALTITSVSAESSTPWNLAAPTAPAVSTANNTSENLLPRCVNSNNWVTHNFQPSDCEGALEVLERSRVGRWAFMTSEFLYEGDRQRTQLPPVMLPDEFVFETCTIKIFITRYYRGAVIRDLDQYPPTEVASYLRIYNAAYDVYRECLGAPIIPGRPRFAGYTFAGDAHGILVVMWDTDSIVNRDSDTVGNSTVNASSIASIEPLVASSSLLTMNPVVAGPSMATAATPLFFDAPPVAPVTGVPGLVNSGPVESAPVEAA